MQQSKELLSMAVECQKNVNKIKLRQFIANHIKLFNINSPDKHYVQGKVQFPLARLINRLTTLIVTYPTCLKKCIFQNLYNFQKDKYSHVMRVEYCTPKIFLSII